MDSARLIAVDPSLTCTGWALFSLASEKLQAVGKLRSQPPSVPLPKRLAELQGRVDALFEEYRLGEGDLLVCEAATTMRDPNAAFKVEYVRGIFEAVARMRGLKVPGRLNPRTVQYEMMGLRGRQVAREEVKATAVSTVDRIYGATLREVGVYTDLASLKRHQDIVDAILVGTVAVRKVILARQGMVELESQFAPRQHRRTVR
jgi:Holliday junction resolvasome RuvABC endonuclease subunit